MFRSSLALFLVACSASGLQPDLTYDTFSQDDQVRVTYDSQTLGAWDGTWQSIEVTPGATRFEIVVQADSALDIVLYDQDGYTVAQPAVGEPVVIENPSHFSYDLEITNNTDETVRGVRVEVEHDGGDEGQPIRIADRTVHGETCFELYVPNGLGTLVVDGIFTDTVSLNDQVCEAGRCEEADARPNAAQRICADGNFARVVAEWVPDQMLVDARGSSSRAYAFDVPSDTDRIRARTSDPNDRIALYVGQARHCDAHGHCTVEEPVTGTWSARVHRQNDSFFQIGIPQTTDAAPDDHGDMDDPTFFDGVHDRAGTLSRGDEDWFRYQTDIDIRVTTQGNTDTFGELYDLDGVLVATNDDGGHDLNFSLDVPAGFDGYIKVRGFSQSTEGGYLLQEDGLLPGEECYLGIVDCSGACVSDETWGDGICDDLQGDFLCEDLLWDGGDCGEPPATEG